MKTPKKHSTVPKKVKYIAISSQLWGQKNARKEFMVEPELKAFIELLVDRVLEQSDEIQQVRELLESKGIGD